MERDANLMLSDGKRDKFSKHDSIFNSFNECQNSIQALGDAWKNEKRQNQVLHEKVQLEQSEIEFLRETQQKMMICAESMKQENAELKEQVKASFDDRNKLLHQLRGDLTAHGKFQDIINDYEALKAKHKSLERLVTSQRLEIEELKATSRAKFSTIYKE